MTMSEHETRLVKNDKVRVAARSVAVSPQKKDGEDSQNSSQDPAMDVEKADDGRVTALVIRCTCGEVIRVRCRYSGGESDESP